MTASVQIKVPFHDCDPLAVVWHGWYLKYFEVARLALFCDYDLDVPQVRELGFKMFVVDARCRYLFPLAYGDEAEITAKVTETRPYVRVAYSVRNLTQQRKSARGYTVLATTDFQGNLLMETPDAIYDRLH